MAFKRDLIIASTDPETNELMLQQIPEDEWRKAQTVTGDLALTLQKMVDAGALLAAVPEDQGGGIGAACYLLNLDSINTK